MKKSNANGDCKWQLSGRWELARCLFPNALCCPCIVWSVYLDGKKTWSDRRAHVMWSPSNSEWKLDNFLTTLRTANYLCQMLSAVAGHCSYQYHFTLVYVQCPPYFVLCTKGRCRDLTGCTWPPRLLLLSSRLPILYLLYFSFPIFFLFLTPSRLNFCSNDNEAVALLVSVCSLAPCTPTNTHMRRHKS